MYVQIHNRFEQYKQDRERNVRGKKDDDMSYIDADSLSKKTKKQGRSDPEIAYRKNWLNYRRTFQLTKKDDDNPTNVAKTNLPNRRDLIMKHHLHL